MSKAVIKQGDCRIGVGMFSTGEEGIFVAFPTAIFDVSSPKAKRFKGADVSTQWAALVGRDTGRLNGVTLEIEWSGVDGHKEAIVIPFTLPGAATEDYLRRIAKDKKIYLVNADNNFQDKKAGGVYADVSKNQQVEWLDMAKAGIPISQWVEKEETNEGQD